MSFSSAPSKSSDVMESTSESEDEELEEDELEEDELEFELNDETLVDRWWRPLPLPRDPRPL